MPVPQQITDALNAVQADADQFAAAIAQDQAADAALASAQAAKQSTLAAVTAAAQHEATDLAALQSLLVQAYGPTTAAPTVPAAG